MVIVEDKIQPKNISQERLVKLTRFIFHKKVIRVESMQPSTCKQIDCNKCRFFQPDGRYHGSCSKMNVTVKGEWKACHLALQAFS
jgi:hypothetical protein